ncbi:MAG: PilZ domain-containing protein [Candidatus Aureabacteria bacterium]|nr:PilZ domain-containing protein [Candidatus Auribacterota bacterium]
MSDFDFISISKILLALGVIILYVTVTFAILISLCRKRKFCTPYHVEFINTEKYKGIEKRCAKRIDVNLEAFIHNKSRSAQHFATIENISSMGLKCKIKDPPIKFKKEDEIIIEIKNNDDIKDCNIPCKLVWSNDDASIQTFGAEFLNKNEALENYILYLTKQTSKKA